MVKGKSGWKESITYVVLFVAIITVTAFVLTSIYWPSGFIFWLIIVFVGVVLLVNWHAKTFKYKCKECGNEFEVSALKDFISPHGVNRNGSGWKYLKCPKCKKRSRVNIIKKY